MAITSALVALCIDQADTAGEAELHRARLCLLDWLGVTIAGSQEPVVAILAADASPDHSARGQRLIGRQELTDLRDAALINGAAGHALDYDDGMPMMMGHPSVAILPALFALAGDREINGCRLLRSIVAGAEAAGRIGMMIGADHYARGFHSTGTIGALAGALAAAYLINLPSDKAVHALGLAGTRAAGLRASFGSDAKPLHAGWAAQIALTSVLWAANGMTGADDILGCPKGLAHTLSNDADPARCLEQTDTAFVETITFKAHAACAVTHPAIDTVAELMRINHFIASDISAVFIRIAPEADSICNIAAPNSGLELKFSIRAVVAMTLLGIDTASPASYSDLLASDAVLKTLIARTNVTLSPDFDLGSTALAIHLEDGRVLERVGGFDFVSDTEQLTQMLIDKFLSLAMPFIGEAAAQQCLAQIMGETQGLSARQLLALAAPA